MAAVPAYELLADRLRDQIVAGALQVGDRLPSEARLAEQEGVSRSTVRESLRMLQEAGLIERSSPRIMVVRRAEDHLAQRHLTDALKRRNVTFAHLYEALLALEPELTRLATERCDEADIAALRGMIRAQERSLERFDEWSRLDQEFHLVIADISANPALIIARAPITELLLPTLRDFMNSRTLTERATRYHHRMLFEIEARDPDLAAAVARRHVNDFRMAWEHAGFAMDQQVAQLGELLPSEPGE
jgi:GntR family transcriptional regulator, transcriptional repressor for pyruvate dehydrogenase complex